MFARKQACRSCLPRKLMENNEIKEAVNAALKYISHRPRSEKEVADKLAQKFEPGIVEQVVADLRKKNIINDDLYLKLLSESGKFKRWGPMKMRAEFKKRGLPEDLLIKMEDSFDIGEFEEQATQIALKKLSSMKEDSTFEQKMRKIQYALASKGYPMSLVQSVCYKVLKPQG